MTKNEHKQGRHAGPEDPHAAAASRPIDADSAARLDEGLAKWDTAFAAYLTLESTDQAASDVLAKFEDAYCGTYPDRQAVCDEQLDAIGWAELLDNFRRRNGIPESYFRWNYEDIWEHVTLAYLVIEMPREIHLFTS